METHKPPKVGVEIFSPLEDDCPALRLIAQKCLNTDSLEYAGNIPQYGEQKTGDPASFFYYDKTHYRHLYFIKA